MSQHEIFTLHEELAFLHDEKYRYENPVPVFSSDDQLLGFARLYPEDGVLMSELFLNYSIPERLDIENGIDHRVYFEATGDLIEKLRLVIEANHG